MPFDRPVDGSGDPSFGPFPGDDGGRQGRELCRWLTASVDAWLHGLFEDAIAGAPEPAIRGVGRVALVAAGGYGRAELCPQSDLDVVLLHDGRADVGVIAERLWYPIWDTGVKLGHAVLTPREALRLAADELDTATALLDARPVAGDAALAGELREAALHQWVSGAGRWLPKLGDALVIRSLTPGEVAFVLEPDLKLGRGGLRDAQILRWLELLSPGLLDGDRDRFEADHERLLEVRVALHRRTGRRGDRLLLQEQDAVAADLGFADADELMAAVAASARSLAWLTDDAFHRVSLERHRARRRRRDVRVGGGIVVRDAQVHLDDDVGAGTDGCVQLLDAARSAAARDLPVARPTLDRFAASDVQFPTPWPIALRERFVELLRVGPGAIPVIETLDHWGLWERALPEWVACRSRPQRNAYHRFTVDRHLCVAAATAAGLAGRVDRPDLLVVGALLHDIGKGHPPRDHTDVGIEIVGAMAPRLGFDDADTEVLVELVRHHLLLPDVATRRDLSDESTIRHVAEAVRSESRLRLLHALTEADSIATGPSAWGEWKAALVRELVDRTARHLAGEERIDVDRTFPTPAEQRLLAEGRRAVRVEGHTVTVVDADRPGFFARVAGALALNGLDVLSANASSDDRGMALNQFTVQNHFGDPIAWEKVQADIEAALRGRLAVRARLAERARVYGRRRPRGPAWAPFDRKVLIDVEASEQATVVEVRAPDALGLLYRVTSALAELDVDIRSARIQTLGDHVVDAFYLRDAAGEKISDPAHLREVERALLHALAE
jgi:[protein-PII] uridylyltransferase